MEKFKYIVDEFADIKIIRYKVDGFDSLKFKQKQYIYCLSQAALVGRDITWDQLYHYNLAIRKSVEAILKSYKGKKKCDNYNKFLEYAKSLFFHQGIYHKYSKEKIVPKCDKIYFKNLLENCNQKDLPIHVQSIDDFIAFIVEAIYRVESSEDRLLNNPTNFYEYVSEVEAKKFYDAKRDETDFTPIEYGLNSKLANRNGILKEEVYKMDGKYSECIKRIIYWLEEAIEVCENKAQREYTQILIDYYKSGDLELWDKYNILWLADISGIVDYVNGFVEVYDDPIGIKGTWEGFVSFVDKEKTKLTKLIADNAQWFEDNSPVDSIYKKKEVNGVSAKVINVVMQGGGAYLSSVLGKNLPNSNWIRSRHGSKSVTMGNFSAAINNANIELPASIKGEFIYNEELLELSEKYGSFASDLHTHFHECLGHASGRLISGVSSISLGEYNSALEEARADLFALYYMMDEKLIQLGIVDTLDIAKAEYQAYIRNGLMVQLARIEVGDDVVQAHMQARKMISEYALAYGKNKNVIEKKIKNNKTYYVVNDYEALREIFADLLNIVQSIKSEGDYKHGRELMETYGIKIDLELHVEVKKRYESLGLKPYSGLLNPSIKEIKKDEEVVDYEISYDNDYLEQQLEYGEKYSFL